MGELTLPMLIGLLLVSLGASLLVVWVTGLVRSPSSKNGPAPPCQSKMDTLLFRDDSLVDHDIEPQLLVPPGALPDLEALENWGDFRSWLGSRFGDLPDSLKDTPEGCSTFDDGLDVHSGLQLQILRNGQTTRVTLQNDGSVDPSAWHYCNLAAHMSYEAMEILNHAPFPVWKTNRTTDTVIWCNTAFSEITSELGAVPEISESDVSVSAALRFSIPDGDASAIRWFEVTSHQISDAETLHIATAIDQVIRAETAQRTFLQTLTKTFANLTTGLAVFDKERRLVLFNPALVDLTGASVSFLSARPDVIRFFDELRERQVLPEPKNYASLRTRIREMIEKAHDGEYLEVWNLPGGVTYRITGRPHPDGAVAFLIEDISAEILKTRQFRTQIDLGQSVIDGLDDAVVVIAPNDMIVLCNTACTELLRFDPGKSFADISVDDLISVCRDQFQSDSLWAVFEAGLRDGNHKSDGFLNARSGERLHYRIKVLPGGVRMICFGLMNKLSSTLPVAAAR